MKRIALCLALVLLISVNVVYGTSSEIDYQGKAEYLNSLDLFEGYGNNFALDKKATRAEAAIMTLRLLGKGDTAWIENKTHPFNDVPEWATREIGYMYNNGLVSGVSKNSLGSNQSANVKDYSTLMLRTLGYSDKKGEFSWGNSLEFSLKIGLVNNDEYKALKESEFNRAGMVLLSYNTFKFGRSNPYTANYLEQLVLNTEVSETVKAFRNSSNSRRNGLQKYSSKFLDVYYPNTEEAKACIELIKPHADKAYIMLCDLYGKQARVEVHLIDEEDASSLKEGYIRETEKVTFVFLEKNNDADGNNLVEFIHEINHNFFNEANGSGTNTMWIDEANSKLIGSLYTENNYEGKADQWSFYDLNREKSNISFDDMNIEKADRLLKEEMAWNGGTGERDLAQRYGMYYWMKVFNTSTIDEFKYYLRNLGNGEVLPKIEQFTGRTSAETDSWVRE